MKCYSIKNTSFNNIIKHIKMGHRNFDTVLSDNRNITETIINSASVVAKNHNITLSTEQIAAFHLLNSPAQIYLYGWMKAHFALIGDEEPNCQEIHIDPVTVKDIYQDYVADCHFTYNVDEAANAKMLASYNTFCSVWKDCFP